MVVVSSQYSSLITNTYPELDSQTICGFRVGYLIPQFRVGVKPLCLCALSGKHYHSHFVKKAAANSKALWTDMTVPFYRPPTIAMRRRSRNTAPKDREREYARGILSFSLKRMCMKRPMNNPIGGPYTIKAETGLTSIPRIDSTEAVASR